MEINGVNIANIKEQINAKNTGYAAIGGLCLTMGSAVVNPVKKYHKPLAITTIGLTLLHYCSFSHFSSKKKNTKEYIA